jgi:integrase/recombinase XerD
MNAYTLALTEREKDIHGLLVPATGGKDVIHRAGKFVDWLEETGGPWYSPDLAAYRDALLESGLAASSVAAHLSTVRGVYRDIIRDNVTRQRLFDAAPPDSTLSDRKAFVDEVLTRLGNALDPDAAPVEVIEAQDEADGDHVRLTQAEAEALLAAPGLGTRAGLRDTAIIAMLLCTGLREAELTGLDVGDLRQRLGGELAVRVRDGKGRKARLVPYGELSWALAIVEKWLAVAGIESGPVFRGFYRGGRLRPTRITPRAVQNILADYPVMIDGALAHARPHDLRRTYARRLYEAGLDLVAIQQNLGHADLRTTLGYIGELDAEKRRAPAVYSFDLRALDALPV